jgi:asparagine synthase (glutamine-hydrolysing)
VQDLLPAELIARPKEGFIMPVNEWLIGHLQNYVWETLSPQKIKKQGIFQPDAVRSMLNAHFSRRHHYGNQIWNLLMLQLWWDRYV